MAWLGSELRIGVDVREVDGRHCGVLLAYRDGQWKVRWLRTRWISWLWPDEIVRWN